MNRNEIIELLQLQGNEQKKLHSDACNILKRHISGKVYFRGLIEFSNICSNDCLYCGIRKSNHKVSRYSMTHEEIMDAVKLCMEIGYSSIVLQSGERKDSAFIKDLYHTIKEIKRKYREIAVTLCIGEQDRDVYKIFFDIGVERYLLRVETASEDHYKKLHPSAMSFTNRLRCLTALKELGYQTGTGVMIGSPYQTIGNLADDILFMKDFDIDMAGMGPFIPHSDSPLKTAIDAKKNLSLSLNMIAVLRMLMPDINIASTTALQALDPNGRELGLLAGANVIMPLITPEKFRKAYMLYDNKPCVDESAEDCAACITNRIRNIGLVPVFNDRGDSVHYKKRIGELA